MTSKKPNMKSNLLTAFENSVKANPELAKGDFAAIVEAGQLNAPGHGLAFSLPLSRIAGIVHLVEDPAAKPEADKKPADKDS